MKQLIHCSSKSLQHCVLIWLLCVALFVLVSESGALGGAIQSDATVQKAFQLRIDGKVDKARLLLEEYSQSDSTNALTYYELSRIFLYMCPGNPKQMQSTIEKAESAIQKAVKIEPDNPIFRYFAARVQFFKSYMVLKSDQENVKSHIEDICRAYESVLESKPDYGEAILNIVELYGGFPVEWGGDTSKAAMYAGQLSQIDHVLAGKAHCIIMPEDFDRIGYWQEMVKKHPGDARILDELGKTCLREVKTDQGIKYLREAMQMDPANTILHLVIANHHILKVMQDKKNMDVSIPLAMESLNDFLSTEPIAPLKAYALGWMAKLNYFMDKKSEGNKWSEQAELADAYFSKATGIPSADLFVPPGEISHHHTYLFQRY